MFFLLPSHFHSSRFHLHSLVGLSLHFYGYISFFLRPSSRIIETPCAQGAEFNFQSPRPQLISPHWSPIRHPLAMSNPSSIVDAESDAKHRIIDFCTAIDRMFVTMDRQKQKLEAELAKWKAEERQLLFTGAISSKDHERVQPRLDFVSRKTKEAETAVASCPSKAAEKAIQHNMLQIELILKQYSHFRIRIPQVRTTWERSEY